LRYFKTNSQDCEPGLLVEIVLKLKLQVRSVAQFMNLKLKNSKFSVPKYSDKWKKEQNERKENE
jgi:hypothetical protein